MTVRAEMRIVTLSQKRGSGLDKCLFKREN
jgi:hypothetical protein